MSLPVWLGSFHDLDPPTGSLKSSKIGPKSDTGGSPFGGHHLGGDLCPPPTFQRATKIPVVKIAFAGGKFRARPPRSSQTTHRLPDIPTEPYRSGAKRAGAARPGICTSAQPGKYLQPHAHAGFPAAPKCVTCLGFLFEARPNGVPLVCLGGSFS